jgi:hypothetical protein
MPTRKEDAKQDQAVEDSFPASDPPAIGGIVGPQATPTHDPKPREPERDKPPRRG